MKQLSSRHPSAGFFEELLFRGVIEQWLDPRIGSWASLAVTSALFGLAHNPVPGASSFTEACYGANFGLLYLVRVTEARCARVRLSPRCPHGVRLQTPR